MHTGSNCIYPLKGLVTEDLDESKWIYSHQDSYPPDWTKILSIWKVLSRRISSSMVWRITRYNSVELFLVCSRGLIMCGSRKVSANAFRQANDWWNCWERLLNDNLSGLLQHAGHSHLIFINDVEQGSNFQPAHLRKQEFPKYKKKTSKQPINVSACALYL